MSGELGQHLNRVPAAAFPCPVGHRGESMDVYERATRWACGQVRFLPRLPWRKPQSHNESAATVLKGQK